MRRARMLIAVAVTAAGFGIFSTAPASAWLFGGGYDEAWCAVSEYTDCSYYTLEQCLRRVSGAGGNCIHNPAHVWNGTERVTRTRKARRVR